MPTLYFSLEEVVVLKERLELAAEEFEELLRDESDPSLDKGRIDRQLFYVNRMLETIHRKEEELGV